MMIKKKITEPTVVNVNNMNVEKECNQDGLIFFKLNTVNSLNNMYIALIMY